MKIENKKKNQKKIQNFFKSDMTSQLRTPESGGSIYVVVWKKILFFQNRYFILFLFYFIFFSKSIFYFILKYFKIKKYFIFFSDSDLEAKNEKHGFGLNLVKG